jgi:transposase-like protein
MKRSRFSEEQIIAVLQEREAGMAEVDVCRRHGISSANFYRAFRDCACPGENPPPTDAGARHRR